MSKLSRDFHESEFACKHCGGVKLHPGFIEALQFLREDFGLPMKVRSGCRCLEHNIAIKGHERSLHVFDKPMHPLQRGTVALDVETPTGIYRGRLFAVAWRHGWSIGWNAKLNFLHLDRRDFVGLPQNSFDY